MNVCTLVQPGLLDDPAFWVALGAAIFLASFAAKRIDTAPPAVETPGSGNA